MLDTRVEEIFEDLKKFLSPGSMWQHILVPQHDLLKSFGTPTTKFKIAQSVFIPLLQVYTSFHTPDIEKKIPKSLTVSQNYVLKRYWHLKIIHHQIQSRHHNLQVKWKPDIDMVFTFTYYHLFPFAMNLRLDYLWQIIE